ncbi:hypothetical protein PSTG_06028 [Puccinia striiformis f. sp. tritici PST-78]|uniref:Uncharacterized protein n=1 Tax=Puccinia striiformis f. sp. tritici PST-78 TaxID=1165861 RepID=A0A0L0VN32_9BASI|nr:hypothetical protein PSTG_06028 [Puccinia striiformis f. sp. tritici PST-78]
MNNNTRSPSQQNGGGSNKRPFLVSRATNEITQFPSYETMYQLAGTTQEQSSASTIHSPSQSSSTEPPTSPQAANHQNINIFTRFINELKQHQQQLNSLDHQPSLRRLIPLILALFGSQLTWIITTFYAIPFLIKLGPSSLSRFILWITFPLAGLIVPTYVGTRSDLQTQATHRRTPAMVYSTLMIVISSISLSFCQPIANFLIYALPLDQGDWDPNRQPHIQSASIAIGILSLYPLAFSINALTQSARSLILDQIVSEHQVLVNIWMTRLLRLADFIVFLIVSSSDNSTTDLHGPNQPNLLRKLMLLTIPILILCSSITCSYEIERPAFENHHPSPTNNHMMFLKSQYKLLKQTIVEIPIPIRRVCYLEILSSTCWLTIFYHAKPLVTRLTLVELNQKHGIQLTEKVIRYAERQGTKAMLNFSIISLISSLVLPWLATIANTEFMINRHGQKWNSIRKILCFITPRNLASFGLLFYSLLMLTTFFIESGSGANLLISFLGLSWALAQWVPLSLVMEYIRSIEETSLVGGVGEEEARETNEIGGVDRRRGGGYRSPVPSSPRLRMPIPTKFEPARVSEHSPLLASSPANLHLLNHPESGSDLPELDLSLDLLNSDRLFATVRGGTYLAIFNLASVVPHFFITIITSTMISIVQLISKIEQETNVRPNNFDPFLVHNNNAGDDTPIVFPNITLWLFRLTGLVGLFAVLVSRNLVIPTSELEYWDEIKFQIFEDLDYRSNLQNQNQNQNHNNRYVNSDSNNDVDQNLGDDS